LNTLFSKFKRYRYLILIGFFIFPFISSVCSETMIDIRSDGVLLNADEIFYVLALDNCTELLSITIQSDKSIKTIPSSETIQMSSHPKACISNFSISGENRFNPEVVVEFLSNNNTDSITYSETFIIETEPPELSFEQVCFMKSDHTQYLQVHVNASDNIDISYVAFSVTGLRASSLRAAGGVIDIAKKDAFASTDDFQKVFPVKDSQDQFILSIPVIEEMDETSIAHDGIVLSDIYAVDSSGNQTAISKIAFTGDDVIEEATDLQVTPKSIIITNLLERFSIIPSVSFQFRGLTPLPGAGTGVKYISSHPDLMAVTVSGEVYALSTTTTENLYINVSYPGLDDINIPVQLDFNKSLTHLKAIGVNEKGQLILNRLNAFFPVPSVEAVFNDNSTGAVNSFLEFEYMIENNSLSQLIFDEHKGLKATGEFKENDHIQLIIRLKQFPEIKATVEIIALDAIPEVELEIPLQIMSEQYLPIKCTTTDDVGILEVKFLMNDSIIGTFETPPFELSIQISEDQVNQTIPFQAIAVDSKGNNGLSEIKFVQVVSQIQNELPVIEIDAPRSMQRYIEETLILLQVKVKIAGFSSNTGISYVEFFLDGKKKGETYFSLFDQREVTDALGMPAKEFYQVWRTYSKLDKISEIETSMGFHAMVHMDNGEKVISQGGVFRILKNSPPSVKLLSPLPGTKLFAGNSVDVNIEIIDDALAMGIDTELMINGETVDSIRYENPSERFSGYLNVQSIQQKMSFDVHKELEGKTIQLQVICKDYHGVITQSEIYRFLVGSDAPPEIAVRSPINGAYIISGLPFEISAEAVDDIKIDHVDFYVADRMVGTDNTQPFSFLYQSISGLTVEQQLKIYATAIDSSAQKNSSAEVIVTIGRDNIPPVIQLVSPEINFTEGGIDHAAVLEEKSMVLKFAGYDNISVTGLEVIGIKKQGSYFLLTGDENDILDEHSFMIQHVPGTTNAFSALKLVKIPTFNALDNLSKNKYKLSATAFDTTGNSSCIEIEIAVTQDKPPVIVDIQSDHPQYFAKDTAVIHIQAKDDHSVNSIQLSYYIDDSNQTISSHTVNITPTGDNIQLRQFVNLNDFNITNVTHRFIVQAFAIDNKGQTSIEAKTFTITVIEDNNGPLTSFETPIQGATLYHGHGYQFFWRAMDSNNIASMTFYMNQQELSHLSFLEGNKQNGSFNMIVPSEGDSLTITITAIDIFDNPSISHWLYITTDDESPKISIRSPAPCSRLYEGEEFTLNMLATDNSIVESLNVLIKEGQDVLFEKQFGSSEIYNAQLNGDYLFTTMRMPHKPEFNDPKISISITATDDNGYTSQMPVILDTTDACSNPSVMSDDQNYPLVVLDDIISPHVSLTYPNTSIKVTPGTYIRFNANGDDNIYIKKISPILADQSNQYSSFNHVGVERNDHNKEIKVPNPNAFGTVILDTHFYMDCEGKAQLPFKYFNHIGEKYQFKINVNDYGYNDAYSNAIEFIIQGDLNPPEIKLITPESIVYINQKVFAHIQISDDICIKSFHIYINGNPIKTLIKEQRINDDIDWSTFDDSLAENTFIDVKDIQIDISDYYEQDKPDNHFILIAEASDLSNTTRETFLVNVLDDSMPVLSVIDEIPSNSLIHGEIALQTIRFDDDFISEDVPQSYYPVYTSLSVNRFLTGYTIDDVPVIGMSYPEAYQMTANLMIKGKPYLIVNNDSIRMWPLYNDPSENKRSAEDNSKQYLKLSFGQDYLVNYHIKVYHNFQCDALTQEKVISSPNGLTLSEIIEDLDEKQISYAIITPEVMTPEKLPIQIFIHSIRVDSGNVNVIRNSLTTNAQNIQILNDEAIFTVFLTDLKNDHHLDFISSHGMMSVTKEIPHNYITLMPVPVHYDIQYFNIFAHGIDIQSTKRGPIPLYLLSSRKINSDLEPPVITTPKAINGTAVVAKQHINLEFDIQDNSGGVSLITLFENNHKTVREISGTYGINDYSIPFEIPETYTGGELKLMLLAEDYSGKSSFAEFTLPVLENQPPEIMIKSFSSYQHKITDRLRIEYGEFWVRLGEIFELEVLLSDDSELTHYEVNRLDAASRKIGDSLCEQDFPFTCPDKAVTQKLLKCNIQFNWNESTQFEILATDNYGHLSRHVFLVHPTFNMSPQIHLIAPIENQYIAAGTFKIKVIVAACDDRQINAKDIEIYANDIQLQRSADAFNNFQSERNESAIPAFNEMYDSIERQYSVRMAEEYGKIDSPYASVSSFLMEIPSGLLRSNESVQLFAKVTDSDNAQGFHEIHFYAAEDNIKPEIAVTNPEIGYGAIENSDFTLSFRAYDNVKVNEIQVFQSYGVKDKYGDYHRTEYGIPLYIVKDIEAEDFEPVTTLNVDTKVFIRLIHTERIIDVLSKFQELTLDNYFFGDVWMKLIARDESGNERIKEFSYPIQIDERPVVDFISPSNGEKVVEGSFVTVNVNAFDDVSIDSLRLIATQTISNQEIFNVLLKQPPYQFLIQVPDFDPENAEKNRLKLDVTAIDSYGSTYNDMDKHKAYETITIEIVEDQPPAILIGYPLNHSTITEGKSFVVEVNAIDDIGLDYVELNISGFIHGKKTYVDKRFPFEFLIDVPYGQAGTDMVLSAKTKEINFNDSKSRRIIQTPTNTIVHVSSDSSPPEILVKKPENNDEMVVERSHVIFDTEITDNVRVSMVQIDLLADKNNDGIFSDSELISKKIMTYPPFHGIMPLKTIEEYFQGEETYDLPQELPLIIKFFA